MFLCANSKESKSCSRTKFCMAESFLITHLDPPESQKVGADISYISDSCHVIKKLPPLYQQKIFFLKINQLETLCWGKKLIQKFGVILSSQVAATVCQILNLSWLPFSPKLFIKQIRFAFRQHQCLSQSIAIIIIFSSDCKL